MDTEFRFCKMKGALDRAGGGGLRNVNTLDVTVPHERSKIQEKKNDKCKKNVQPH